MTEASRDRVALLLAATIGAFVLVSLVFVFVLGLRGEKLDDVWAALFALMMAVLGALGGWLAGKRSAD